MLDKAKVTAIQADLKAAMEVVAKKHNLNLTRNYISYHSDSFKLTADFGDRSEIGDTNPVYIKDMRKFGWQFKLGMEHLNKTITTAKGTETVIGMKERWVITKDSAGKLWKKDPVMVATMLGVK